MVTAQDRGDGVYRGRPRPGAIVLALVIAGLAGCVGAMAPTPLPKPAVPIAVSPITGGRAAGDAVPVAHSPRVLDTVRGPAAAAGPPIARHERRRDPDDAGAGRTEAASGQASPGMVEGSLETGRALVGTWTVRYTVGPANGDGENIRIPLGRIDHRVVGPGATFDFWQAVGEVSRRTGYRRGGVIVGNRVDPNGALAGGICTVSTVVFNAAARAGLAITARTAHGGYLPWYPLGLDAAVAKGPGWAQTLAFRNDTHEPITIRTVSEPGLARVDLYAPSPLDRHVTLHAPVVSHRVRALDRRVRSAGLAAGVHRRVRIVSDGMTVVVVRLVRDGDGRLLHRDVWRSTYRALDGLVVVGTR